MSFWFPLFYLTDCRNNTLRATAYKGPFERWLRTGQHRPDESMNAPSGFNLFQVRRPMKDRRVAVPVTSLTRMRGPRLQPSEEVETTRALRATDNIVFNSARSGSQFAASGPSR